MAEAKLSEYSVASTVQLAENGTLTEYIVIHIGLPDSSYDSSCDGVWLLRKYVLSEGRVWGEVNSANVSYPQTGIDTYLTDTFLQTLDPYVQRQAMEAKLPTVVFDTTGSSTVSSTVNRKIFLLNLTEVNAGLSYFSVSGRVRATDENFYWRAWWLRDVYCYSAESRSVRYVDSNGSIYVGTMTTSRYVRPVLILPRDTTVIDGVVMSAGKPFYFGDDSSKAQLAGKAYLGIDNVAKQISKAYLGDENNVAQLVFEGK